MAELLRNRWAQLAAVGALTAVLGVVVGALIYSGGPSGTAFGPVKLTAGGSVFTAGAGLMTRGYGADSAAAEKIVDLELPRTGAEAIAAGWKDPILCSTGRGKYFQKTGDPDVPYILMYDNADELIGVYMVSDTEMPSPWESAEQITSGGAPVIDYEHWGLFVYFGDPTRACRLDTERGASGCVPGSC